MTKYRPITKKTEHGANVILVASLALWFMVISAIVDYALFN